MADNDRVEYISNDIAPGQQAPSQANRSNFVPGTTGEGNPQDANWPEDFRIPQGTPAFDGEAAGPVEMERTRVVKLHRNTVSDQVLQGDGEFPHTEAPETTTITNPAAWGATTPSHTVTPTEEDEADGRYERQAGNDNIKGA